MATALATAYIDIIPSMGPRGRMGRDIAREFAGVGRQAESAGRESGGKFSSAFKGSMAGIAGAFAAVGIGSFIKDSIQGAGDLEQSVGAIESVFKGSAGQMKQWSKSAAKNVGLTSNEFNELGTLIGSQLKNGGTAMEDLAPKTNKLIGLGADLSSMFGGTTKEALEAVSSALRGESDPIERYGVSLSAARVEAKALAQGAKKVGGELSMQAKQTAILALITEQTADAQGNFAKESDTFAHKQQVMAAEWGNLATKIGDLFLPVLTTVFSFISEKVIPVLGEVVGGVRAFGEAFKAGDGDITSSGLPGFMERVGMAARGLYDLIVKGDYKGLLRDAFGWEEDSPAVDAILNIRDTALKVPAALEDVKQSFADVSKKLWDMRVPIGIVAALIVAVLIPHWVALGVEALKSAVKQKAAWIITQVEAAKSAVIHSGAVMAMVGGWVLMGAQATIQAVKIAAAWLIALGPVGWVIAAVVAVVAAFVLAYNNIGWFKDGVDAAMRWISDAVANAFKWIQDVIGSVVDWFTGTLIPAWNAAVKGVGDFFKGLGDAVGAVFKGVQDVIGAVVNWFNSVIVPAFRVAVGAVVAVFQSIYNFLKPTFESIGVIVNGFRMFFEGVFNLVVAYIQKIVIPLFMGFWNRMVEAFTGIGTAISSWWNGVVAVFNLVVNYIQTVLAAAFTWFRDSVITPVWNAVTSVVKTAWNNISNVFNLVVNFIRTVLSTAFTWFRDTVITPVWNAISSTVKSSWAAIGSVFNLVVSFIRTTLANAFNWFRDNVIKPVWERITNIIRNTWEQDIKPVFDTLSNFITKTIPKAFDQGVAAVKKAWDGLQEIAKAPVRFVINTVINDGLIAGFNSLAVPLGVKALGKVGLPAGFADGGYTGPGGKYQPAGIVHAGEVVWSQNDIARWGGVGVVESMRKAAGYAKGGIVNPLKHMALTQGYNHVHKGIDLAAAVGTPVYASQGGRVSWAGPGVQAPGVWGGNEIHVAGNGIETWFAHLSQIGVKLGQQVRAGQQIGLSGNTGITSGPHLHFGTFAGGWPNDIDPLAYLGGAGIPSGGGFNPLGMIIDGLMSKVREAGGGPFADIAIGIGKKVIDSASKFVTNFLSGNTDKGNATATVFDGGGWLENTGGSQLVQHNKRKPDAVLSHDQWQTMTRIADNSRGSGVTFTGPVHVRDENELASIISTRQRDAHAAYGF